MERTLGSEADGTNAVAHQGRHLGGGETLVKAAKERRAALEARDFIPAKKFGTPPENFVFKLGLQGLGFYRDGGPTEVSLNGSLFPLVVGTAPMQLRLEQFVNPTAAEAAAKSAHTVKAMMQMTTEDLPLQANQETGRCKRKKKERKEGEQREGEMEMAFNPNHGGWPADASIALADKGVKKAK